MNDRGGTPAPPYHDAARPQRIDDRLFRQGVTLGRWIISALYLYLSGFGALDIGPVALALTAGPLIVFNLVFTWQRLFREQTPPKFLVFTRHFDPVIVAGVLIGVHDVTSPVWAVYFINIMAAAHLMSRRDMVFYALWCAGCYLAAGTTIAAMGHGVSWGYVSVVEALILFMGLNAMIVAGGEQRVRSLIAELAVTDSLTGLPNRRRFHEAYLTTLDDAIARRLPLALMLLDVDHFKEINDRDGHPAGDDKLREVALALSDAVRRGDLVARYGGDEFVIVAPETSRADAVVLAERLRHAAIACGTSVSVGVAMFPEDAQRQEDLIEAADAALYRAKEAGRNCVRIAAA